MRLHLCRENVLRMTVPVLVEFPVDLRGAHAEVGDGQHPLELPLGKRGAQLVAVSRADRRAAGERERYVGTELGGQHQQFVTAEPGFPEGVAGQQGGRSIRGSSAHSTRDRNVLLDLKSHTAAIASFAREQGSGFQGKVGAIRGEGSGVNGAGEGDREVVCRAGAHILVERDGLVSGGHFVIAVGEQRAHLQIHIDLAWCAHVHHLGRGSGGHGSNLVDRLVQSLRERAQSVGHGILRRSAQAWLGELQTGHGDSRFSASARTQGRQHARAVIQFPPCSRMLRPQLTLAGGVPQCWVSAATRKTGFSLNPARTRRSGNLRAQSPGSRAP